PDEAAWLLGEGALDQFERMEGSAPPQWFSSQAGGLHLFRGAGALVAVSAGPNGQGGFGGHSHNDKLSFELHLNGAPAIVDPGSPTYLRDLAQRTAFRSTSAHNSVQLDGREQSPLDPARPFALPDEARARVEELERFPWYSKLVASHLGYASMHPPVHIRRTFFLHHATRALLICDELLGGGSHSAVGRLHLPDREVRLRQATAEELARAQSAILPRAEPSTPLRYARAERRTATEPSTSLRYA